MIKYMYYLSILQLFLTYGYTGCMKQTDASYIEVSSHEPEGYLMEAQICLSKC